MSEKSTEVYRQLLPTFSVLAQWAECDSIFLCVSMPLVKWMDNV